MVRGIHCSQYSKLVTVTRGAIVDIIVDLRKGSASFGRWSAVKLSSDNKRQVFIPAGCGHAFLCIDDADVLYLQGGCFNSSGEKDICPFDPTIGIPWPKFSSVTEYIVSQKDQNAPRLLDHKSLRSSEAELAFQKKRILIIGASGQVGGALCEAFDPNNHVIGTFSTTAVDGMFHFDLRSAATDHCLADELIMFCCPDIVCICAGMTWVDGCEAAGEEPFLVNRDGPRAVVRAAKRFGAKTVYYSTDYVFDGTRENYVYAEDDPVNPLNVYGCSKAEGEAAILEEDPTCLVLRTTGVYGPEKQGKNFVHQLCRCLLERKPMPCATDSFGSPTYNRDLAKMTIGLLTAGAQGVFNCVGPETMSRRDFAEKIATTLNLDSSVICSTMTDDMYESTKKARGFAAKRGKYLGLSMAKTTSALPPEYHPRPVTEALLHWKANARGFDICFCQDV